MGQIGEFLLRQRAAGRRARHTRGLTAEALVLKALGRASRPDWILEVRPATEAENARGIDVVIESRDRGTLLLQVKSSERYAAAWRRREAKRGKRRPIEVVVVPPGSDLNTIYGLVLGALIKIRERPELLRTRHSTSSEGS